MTNADRALQIVEDFGLGLKAKHIYDIASIIESALDEAEERGKQKVLDDKGNGKPKV